MSEEREERTSSAPKISRHETGRITLRGFQALDYAAALSIRAEWLLFGAGSKRAR